MIRRIIKIDQEKCNGCGACATACHEGAIDMVNGKAVLTREDYCDGLGDCLPNCPTGAITFEEREAPAYNEAAVKAAQAAKQLQACGCPGEQAKTIAEPQSSTAQVTTVAPSELRQWPVQIKLVPVNAPFFDGAKLLIAADCTGIRLWKFPSGIYPRPRHAHRLSKTRRGRLQRKTCADHRSERHQIDHRYAHGGSLLRRHRARCEAGARQERQADSMAGCHHLRRWADFG